MEEAKALRQFRSDKSPQGHVIDQHEQPDMRTRSSDVIPIGTSSVITAISASRSRPRLRRRQGIGSRGPRKHPSRLDTGAGRSRTRRAPRRLSPCAQALRGSHRPILRPLIGARQGRGAIGFEKENRIRRPLKLVGKREEFWIRRATNCPAPPEALALWRWLRRPRQISGHTQLAVAPGFQRGELHRGSTVMACR